MEDHSCVFLLYLGCDAQWTNVREFQVFPLLLGLSRPPDARGNLTFFESFHRTYTHENTCSLSLSRESYHCALLKILSLQSFEPRNG